VGIRMTKLVAADHPALHRPAEPVLPGDFGNVALREQAAALLSVFDPIVEARQGVGLAAPQIGLSRSIIVVEDRGALLSGPRWYHDLVREPFARRLVYNPRVLRRSTESICAWETCLSEPSVIGLVDRPRQIEVAFDSGAGVAETIHVADWTARIFLHEIDHLKGCLCSRLYLPGSKMPTADYQSEWKHRPLPDALRTLAAR